jgi:anti-anti-sigma factor
LIVDLSGVDYLNGAGLRVFEAAAAQFDGTECQFIVCGLRPVVSTTFELAGRIPNLTFAESRGAAMAMARSEASAGVKKA